MSVAPGCIVAVAAGASHALAITDRGRAWNWGYGQAGQLGNDALGNSCAPVQPLILPTAVSISGGEYHSLAALSDGAVWAWGEDSSGELGDGTTVNQRIPVRAQGLASIVAVSAGWQHSLALAQDGSVWAWGRNLEGQLGTWNNATSLLPVQVIGLPPAILLARNCYYHSIAVVADGSAWAWGWNAYGQLGDGSLSDSNRPRQVRGLSSVTQVAEGIAHSVALRSDGTVWAWGYNGNGQLGDGAFTSSPTPVQVAGLNDVVAIAAGNLHSLAVKRDGTVWAWGDNAHGQLGDGSLLGTNSPRQVVGLAGARDVAGGVWFSLALLQNGTTWAWGTDSVGQLGDGACTASYSTSPVPVDLTSVCEVDSPPICFAGAPKSLQCGAVELTDATASDPDGDSLAYAWTSSCPDTEFQPSAHILNPAAAFDPSCHAACTLALTASDGRGGETSSEVVVSVGDTVPPILSGVPVDATVECDAVPAPASVTASDNCDPSPGVAFAEVRLDGPCPGTYLLTRTWTATDRCGNASTGRQLLHVQDTTPPVILVSSAGSSCLWPPNHRMACFTTADFTPAIWDNCSPPVTWRFVGCASNQPDDGLGDGHTTRDCQVSPDGQGICVRAERSGTDPSGRRYRVEITATDACGNTSAPVPVATIVVPHDMSPMLDCTRTRR